MIRHYHKANLLICIYFLLARALFAIGALESIANNELENVEVIGSNDRQLRAAPPTAAEILATRKMKPLKVNNEYIMFWRPQKVGSSTILSILMSYAYRYNVLPRRKTVNNAFCKMIGYCATKNLHYEKNASVMQKLQKFLAGNQKDENSNIQNIEQQIRSITSPFQMSLTHELCNFDATILQQHLLCAFDAQRNTSNRGRTSASSAVAVKEVFLVREPLSRAVSIYYFWGELFKLAQERKVMLEGKKGRKQQGEVVPVAQLHDLHDIKLGKNVPSNKTIEGNLFRYHGDENTVPSVDIAVKFATTFPFRAGMPGPSFTWSAFASSPQTAIARIEHTDTTANPLVTLVLERLDESLILLRHAFAWSLADVVTIMHRKALSSHPKHPSWPKAAVDLLRTKLNNTGEFAVYRRSHEMLDRQLQRLTKEQGVNVEEELTKLRELRHKAAEVSLMGCVIFDIS